MDLVLIRHPAVAVPSGECYGRSDVPLRDTAAAGAAAIAAKLARLGISRYTLHSSPLRRCAEVAQALARAHPEANRADEAGRTNKADAADATDGAAHRDQMDRPNATHDAHGSAHDKAHDGTRDSMVRCPDPRLAELDFGDWEGQRWDDVPRAALDAWAADIERATPHGGESVAQLAERTDHWLAEIGARTAPAGTATVVLTHAGVIRVMTARALSLPTLTCLNWTLGMTGICRLSRAQPGDRWTLALWNG